MLIFSIVVGSIISVIVLGVLLTSINRKQKSKGWKVGDVLILNNKETSLNLDRQLKESNETPLLSGWDRNNVFVQVGDRVYMETWSAINTNKSDSWRKRYESCKEYMGTNPGFSSEVKPESQKNNFDMIDGQPISTLNETMCNIYLKQALEEQNFELAEKLRKRLENFR